jgi:predicted lysophospholipase L1 biosynthesis ABC-type transport system permease subunit
MSWIVAMVVAAFAVVLGVQAYWNRRARQEAYKLIKTLGGHRG